MPSARRVLLTTFLVLTAGAAPLLSQERDGFFFGLGLGYGSNWVNCNECDQTRADGFAGFFKIGAHLNEKFSLAFESNGWFGSVERSDVWSSNWSAVGYFYPGGGNFYLRGGLGPAYLQASFDGVGFGTRIETAWGFGATAGIGYDFPVGFVAVLNPVINVNYGSYGTIRTPTGDLTGVNSLILQLALGLTFQ